MLRGRLHQLLHFLCRRTIFPFANYPRLVPALRKHARSRLIAMRDADLERVVVQSYELRGSSVFVFLHQELVKTLAIADTVVWLADESLRVGNGGIEALDVEASSVAGEEFRGGEGADFADTVESEVRFEVCTSGGGRTVC